MEGSKTQTFDINNESLQKLKAKNRVQALFTLTIMNTLHAKFLLPMDYLCLLIHGEMAMRGAYGFHVIFHKSQLIL